MNKLKTIQKEYQRLISIDKYDWKEIDFPSQGKDWKKFESNNKSVALNILYVPHNTEKIRHAYKSKYNLTRENQVILLMITDKEAFYRNLNMEDITAVDYRHGKTVFEYLINKNLGDYHDLYIQK